MVIIYRRRSGWNMEAAFEEWILITVAVMKLIASTKNTEVKS